ncbi:MAG: class I SAM-dependent methyltransferase [Acidobacteriota bacterium]|nr:class I SAM-dependent methyltransferase [Acidobacteriota bacterium]
MHEAMPSRTALRVALRRAAHQLYDAPPRVLDDPLAVTILGREYASEVQRTRFKLGKPHSVALRAFLVARSRYAEDQLAFAVSPERLQPVVQYVLLGAGLDTFGYRNPYPQVEVVEVDHPATQAWKQTLLAEAGIEAPVNLTYVPVDFEHRTLAEALEEAGISRRRPTLFAWLGVVPYLTHEAFAATLDLIASFAGGSGVVLDYSQPREVLPHFEQLAHDSLAARVRQAGEPFQLFLTPEQARAALHRFSAIEDLGTAELNARYFRDRDDLLAAQGTAARLLSAWL